MTETADDFQEKVVGRDRTSDQGSAHFQRMFSSALKSLIKYALCKKSRVVLTKVELL